MDCSCVDAARRAEAKASAEQALDHLRDAVVVVRRGRLVSRGLNHGFRMGHGDAAPCPAQHLDVVERIAEGDHVGAADAEVLAEAREPGGLRDARYIGMKLGGNNLVGISISDTRDNRC